jgi:hypothetical protein
LGSGHDEFFDHTPSVFVIYFAYGRSHSALTTQRMMSIEGKAR